MNDPDGFNAIDDKTIVFSIGGVESFWYPIDKGPTPVAIISDFLDETLGRPMLKPQSDLLSKYYSEEVAAAGFDGLGKTPTKFWRRT